MQLILDLARAMVIVVELWVHVMIVTSALRTDVGL